MRKVIFLSIITIILLGGPGRTASDPLDNIKEAMKQADCCRFEFTSILYSDIFESVDSTVGTALIAKDGRYYVEIGTDAYVRTFDKFYSYSQTQNQVTVERVEAGIVTGNEVSFITNLDDFFQTTVVLPGEEYRLRRNDSPADGLPDSLMLYLGDTPPHLERIEYYDLNDDLTVIVFRTRHYLSECDDSTLEPHFPDSVEVIRLY